MVTRSHQRPLDTVNVLRYFLLPVVKGRRARNHGSISSAVDGQVIHYQGDWERY